MSSGEQGIVPFPPIQLFIAVIIGEIVGGGIVAIILLLPWTDQTLSAGNLILLLVGIVVGGVTVATGVSRLGTEGGETVHHWHGAAKQFEHRDTSGSREEEDN